VEGGINKTYRTSWEEVQQSGCILGGNGKGGKMVKGNQGESRLNLILKRRWNVSIVPLPGLKDSSIKGRKEGLDEWRKSSTGGAM